MRVDLYILVMCVISSGEELVVVAAGVGALQILIMKRNAIAASVVVIALTETEVQKTSLVSHQQTTPQVHRLLQVEKVSKSTFKSIFYFSRTFSQMSRKCPIH